LGRRQSSEARRSLNLKLILENRNLKELNIWESIFIQKRNNNPNHTLLNKDEGPSASLLTRFTERDSGGNHQFTHVKI
jgi:hypothetical protein